MKKRELLERIEALENAVLEKKEAVKDQWIPKVGDTVYGLLKDGENIKPIPLKWTGRMEDKMMLKKGVIFKTEQLALDYITAPAPTEPPRPEPIPAEPLREIPEEGAWVWASDPDPKFHSPPYASQFADTLIFRALFQAGLLFPNTPEGKLGAERRASEGIVPYPVRPAPALTEAPEVNDHYWMVDDDTDEILSITWDGDDAEFRWLSEGRIFSDNRRGKIGAAMFQEGGQDV